MEDKKIKVLDGVIEVSLRTLCILYEVRQPMTKDRLSAYDYFTLYSKDMDPKYNNLFSEIRMHSTSYIGEIRTIPSAINMLLSRELVNFSFEGGNLAYTVSEIGEQVVENLLSDNFSDKLFKHIRIVKDYLNSYTEQELDVFVKSHITNWNHTEI